MAGKTKRAIKPSKASKLRATATTTPPSPNANLSCMPNEVIEMIVYWINHLPSTQPIPQNQQTNPVYKEVDHEDKDLRGLRKFQKQSNGNPLNDIRSLASVNRSFYQICTPYLFESLNFTGLTVDRLTSTLEETIKKYAYHVQKLQWRVSNSKSASEEREELVRSNKSRYDRSWKSQWGPKARSGLLLKILKACPNLVHLDVDLDPEPSMPTKTSETRARSFQDLSSSSSYDQMPNIFIKPISQLTSLTHLSLTCPDTRPSYTETFLVDILSNLHQLQSFGCSSIAADRLGGEKAPQSPLGLHLASLTCLTELHLQGARCLDARWNQYKWKSSLKALSLKYCYSVSDSFSDLHGFVQLFKSTLTTLILVSVPEPLESGPDATIQFKLPRLTNLEISTWTLGRFPRAFEHSKKLSWLSLGDEALSRPRKLQRLIRDRLWPKLKTFEISSVESCTREEVSGLEDLCRKYGIEIIFHTEFYSSEEEEEEEDDDDDHSGCDLSFFYKSKKKDQYEDYFGKRPGCAYADSYDSSDSNF